MLELLKGLRAEDIVLCLLSGGGSALWPAPAEGITLAQKQEVTSLLLRAGATILELNAVRKHLSAIKGGQLGGAGCSGAAGLADHVRRDWRSAGFHCFRTDGPRHDIVS